MLRARIEIVPFGYEDGTREIAELTIALQRKDEHDLGYYVSRLVTDQDGPTPPHGTVRLIHERSTGAVELVRAALAKHLGHPYAPAR